MEIEVTLLTFVNYKLQFVNNQTSFHLFLGNSNRATLEWKKHEFFFFAFTFFN